MAQLTNASVIKQRIAARGTVDSDNEAWVVARGIGQIFKTKYHAKKVLVHWLKNTGHGIPI